jgi:hypothetical protein
MSIMPLGLWVGVSQAHLKTQATQHDPAERYRWKWRLLRGLYERGFSREDVVTLFHFLDWLMRLPAELEQQLWRELQAEEEARKMQYVRAVWNGLGDRRACSRAWNPSGSCCCGWCDAVLEKR